MSVQPRFPIFVPTLSRADSRLTIKALQRMHIEHWYAVVEPQEHDLYAAVIPEDTILSLDMLKDGWCTVQFNGFQQKKVATQTVKGGNDKVFYSVEGTLPKSQMLVDTYPEYARLVTKFGRAHHHVDYRPFRSNKLHRIEGLEIPAEPDYYGVELRKIAD